MGRRRLEVDVYSVRDMRRLAKARIPKLFFDYVDGGSHEESTRAANESDFRRWTVDTRVLRNVGEIDLTAVVLGRPHTMPLALGPVGYLGMLNYRGDVGAARAAAAAGISACVSTFSIASMEEISAAAAGRTHYQIYMFRDRELCQDMLARAKACGMDVLIVTVDTPVTPLRERDARNGFREMDRPSAGQLLDMARRPAWCTRMARGGMPEVGNAAGYGMGRGVMAQSGALARQIDPTLTWADLAFLRQAWAGRLLIKGLLTPDDALRALDSGADGIVVSNHGGRQLDGAPSTISVLPSICEAVRGRMDILLDSGVRRGLDVAIALACGADAVLLGRAQAFAVAAAGQAGVAHLLNLFEAELRSTLALMGVTSIAELRAEGPHLFRRKELVQ